jgi:predicted amidohydrolase
MVTGNQHANLVVFTELAIPDADHERESLQYAAQRIGKLARVAGRNTWSRTLRPSDPWAAG